MKFEYLALCLVLGTGCFCLVSARNADAATNMPLEAQPTVAPLMTSSPRPTVAPRVTAPPTRAMIHNVPPRKIMAETNQMPEAIPMKSTPIFMPAMKTEMKVKDAKPVQLNGFINAAEQPAMMMRNEPISEAEKPGKKQVHNKKASPMTKSGDNKKAMQVTGFITKNGSIYEIEDQEGMGQIEGRQNPDEKDNKQETIVCNHGSVVIYSDVPCSELTSVHVGGVQQTVEGEQTPNEQTTKKPQTANNTARRQNNRNGVRNNNNKRRRGNGNGIRNGNRNGNGNGNRQQMVNRNRRNKNRQNQKPLRNQQQRKKQQQKKLRRQQMQRQQQKRRQQQQQQQQQQRPQQQQQQQKRRRRPQQQQNQNQNRRRNQNRRINNGQRQREEADEELEYNE